LCPYEHLNPNQELSLAAPADIPQVALPIRPTGVSGFKFPLTIGLFSFRKMLQLLIRNSVWLTN
jgi:hypothetical protein